MKLKICIVLANYYPKISKDLLRGSIKVLKKNKFNFKLFYAPGVFEIPVIISKKIKTFDAFIALGCVIKGQTPHFHFISKATTNAIMDLSINHKKPIGNGIITCLNMKQAIRRANPKGKNKGAEAANAILKVLEV
tara:strand:- start:306 stop:710 length:405 start_codon:yes stop_codon:yes gene_type:complete